MKKQPRAKTAPARCLFIHSQKLRVVVRPLADGESRRGGELETNTTAGKRSNLLAAHFRLIWTLLLLNAAAPFCCYKSAKCTAQPSDTTVHNRSVAMEGRDGSESKIREIGG